MSFNYTTTDIVDFEAMNITDMFPEASSFSFDMSSSYNHSYADSISGIPLAQQQLWDDGQLSIPPTVNSSRVHTHGLPFSAMSSHNNSANTSLNHGHGSSSAQQQQHQFGQHLAVPGQQRPQHPLSQQQHYLESPLRQGQGQASSDEDQYQDDNEDDLDPDQLDYHQYDNFNTHINLSLNNSYHLEDEDEENEGDHGEGDHDFNRKFKNDPRHPRLDHLSQLEGHQSMNNSSSFGFRDEWDVSDQNGIMLLLEQDKARQDEQHLLFLQDIGGTSASRGDSISLFAKLADESDLSCDLFKEELDVDHTRNEIFDRAFMASLQAPIQLDPAPPLESAIRGNFLDGLHTIPPPSDNLASNGENTQGKGTGKNQVYQTALRSFLDSLKVADPIKTPHKFAPQPLPILWNTPKIRPKALPSFNLADYKDHTASTSTLTSNSKAKVAPVSLSRRNPTPASSPTPSNNQSTLNSAQSSPLSSVSASSATKDTPKAATMDLQDNPEKQEKQQEKSREKEPAMRALPPSRLQRRQSAIVNPHLAFDPTIPPPAASSKATDEGKASGANSLSSAPVPSSSTGTATSIPSSMMRCPAVRKRRSLHQDMFSPDQVKAISDSAANEDQDHQSSEPKSPSPTQREEATQTLLHQKEGSTQTSLQQKEGSTQTATVQQEQAGSIAKRGSRPLSVNILPESLTSVNNHAFHHEPTTPTSAASELTGSHRRLSDETRAESSKLPVSGSLGRSIGTRYSRSGSGGSLNSMGASGAVASTATAAAVETGLSGSGSMEVLTPTTPTAASSVNSNAYGSLTGRKRQGSHRLSITAASVFTRHGEAAVPHEEDYQDDYDYQDHQAIGHDDGMYYEQEYDPKPELYQHTSPPASAHNSNSMRTPRQYGSGSRSSLPPPPPERTSPPAQSSQYEMASPITPRRPLSTMTNTYSSAVPSRRLSGVGAGSRMGSQIMLPGIKTSSPYRSQGRGSGSDENIAGPYTSDASAAPKRTVSMSASTLPGASNSSASSRRTNSASEQEYARVMMPPSRIAGSSSSTTISSSTSGSSLASRRSTQQQDYSPIAPTRKSSLGAVVGGSGRSLTSASASATTAAALALQQQRALMGLEPHSPQSPTTRSGSSGILPPGGSSAHKRYSTLDSTSSLSLSSMQGGRKLPTPSSSLSRASGGLYGASASSSHRASMGHMSEYGHGVGSGDAMEEHLPIRQQRSSSSIAAPSGGLRRSMTTTAASGLGSPAGSLSRPRTSGSSASGGSGGLSAGGSYSLSSATGASALKRASMMDMKRHDAYSGAESGGIGSRYSYANEPPAPVSAYGNIRSSTSGSSLAAPRSSSSVYQQHQQHPQLQQSLQQHYSSAPRMASSTSSSSGYGVPRPSTASARSSASSTGTVYRRTSGGGGGGGGGSGGYGASAGGGNVEGFGAWSARGSGSSASGAGGHYYQQAGRVNNSRY